MVTINGSESDTVYENTTSSPTLPLGFLEDEVADLEGCKRFKFTVQATNDAGSGPISEPVVDTIPLCKVKKYVKLNDNTYLFLYSTGCNKHKQAFDRKRS